MYGKARRGDDTGRQVVYSVSVTVEDGKGLLLPEGSSL